MNARATVGLLVPMWGQLKCGPTYVVARGHRNGSARVQPATRTPLIMCVVHGRCGKKQNWDPPRTFSRPLSKIPTRDLCVNRGCRAKDFIMENRGCSFEFVLYFSLAVCAALIFYSLAILGLTFTSTSVHRFRYMHDIWHGTRMRDSTEHSTRQFISNKNMRYLIITHMRPWHVYHM